MSRYLFQGAYTAESWASQVRSQGNVIDRISPLLRACHGTLECAYYAFGDVDIVALLDFPSAEDAAAFSLAATAGGSLKSARTTPLLTVDEGLAAMRTAAEAARDYHPPVQVPTTTA